MSKNKYYSNTTNEFGQKITRVWVSEKESKRGASGYVARWHNLGEVQVNYSMGMMTPEKAKEIAALIDYAAGLEIVDD